MKGWFRATMVLSLLFPCIPFPIQENESIRMRTPTPGYQPLVQIVGERIYYVRHEDHGPKEPISVAREAVRDVHAVNPSNPKTPSEKELLEARRILNELMDTVRGLLLEEIQKGGFTGAVRVCSELAQEMTNRFSTQTGHTVRRVSLRYRNPKNIPDAYETRRLQELDRLNREKRLPEEIFEVVEEGGVKYFRYLKPLTLAPLCLTCHCPKENIPSEVLAILKEKYPEDRATGFLVGDLRGAISVKIDLSKQKR